MASGTRKHKQRCDKPFHAALVVRYSAVARSIACIYMQMNSRGPEQESEGQLIN